MRVVINEQGAHFFSRDGESVQVDAIVKDKDTGENRVTFSGNSSTFTSTKDSTRIAGGIENISSSGTLQANADIVRIGGQHIFLPKSPVSVHQETKRGNPEEGKFVIDVKDGYIPWTEPGLFSGSLYRCNEELPVYIGANKGGLLLTNNIFTPTYGEKYGVKHGLWRRVFLNGAARIDYSGPDGSWGVSASALELADNLYISVTPPSVDKDSVMGQTFERMKIKNKDGEEISIYDVLFRVRL